MNQEYLKSLSLGLWVIQKYMTKIHYFQPESIQIQYKDKQILAWTMFNAAIPDGEISLNPLFCKHVGLEEGVEVFVTPYPDIKVLNEIYIDADSADDQEILVNVSIIWFCVI